MITNEQEKLAAAILAAHDPSPSAAQRIAAVLPHAREQFDWLQVRAVLLQAMAPPALVDEAQRHADAAQKRAAEALI